ncbi:MAG: hypothetical protein IJ538_04515 [Clostridia bacterium]|nr:hypothetical protein [Clostridia bacterium]
MSFISFKHIHAGSNFRGKAHKKRTNKRVKPASFLRQAEYDLVLTGDENFEELMAIQEKCVRIIKIESENLKKYSRNREKAALAKANIEKAEAILQSSMEMINNMQKGL